MDDLPLWTVLEGDCLDVMKTFDDEVVDAVVCDPPAAINFMGQKWDSNRGGREQWVAWLAERLREAKRVLKPGGHILVWALPRTSHWTALAIEEAGFDIRDRVSHFFASGFPKGGMISKKIDKKLGVKPIVVGENPNHRPVSGVQYEGIYQGGNTGSKYLTTPTSPEAKQWDGWGSALKPACEDWWLARKPFKGSLTQNVLDRGTGALNIDACRILTADKLTRKLGKTTESDAGWRSVNRSPIAGKDGGRWPAHIVFSHHPMCGAECTADCPIEILDGQSGVLKSGERKAGTPNGEIGYHGGGQRAASEKHYEADSGGASRFFFTCHPDCPVRQLDIQSGITKSGAMKREVDAYEGESTTGFLRGASGPHNQHGDEGGASRFYYCAKSTKKERNAGLPEGMKNDHTTVKSIELMRWLCRLVTPPQGIVLDCFAGSGSTGVACAYEDFGFVGIELDPHYAEIARYRIKRAENEASQQRDNSKR